MKIIKTKSTVDAQGLLIISMIPTGLAPGGQVNVVLAAKGDKAAPFLLLTQTGIEVAIPLYTQTDEEMMTEKEEPEDEGSLNLPAEVLEETGIYADSDLEIICGYGVIVILASDILNRLLEELAGLFQELGIHPDTIREVMRKEGYYL